VVKKLLSGVMLATLGLMLVSCGSTGNGSPAPTATVTVTAMPSAAASDGATGSDAGGWVKVFTWKGGAKGNCLRSSERFTLEGGQQRVDTVVRDARNGYSESPTAYWEWIDADGSSADGIATEKAKDSALYYLPSGEYHIRANTIDCYWTLTVWERP